MKYSLSLIRRPCAFKGSGAASRRRRGPSPSRHDSLFGQYRLYVVVLGLLLGAMFGAGWVRSVRSSSHSSSASTWGRTAAILDQVGLTEPNPAFIDEALGYLASAGFNVDVYEGEDITVSLLRNLPTYGYDLIVFRTHATNDFRNTTLPGDPVYIYTGERHDRYRYTYQQLTRQIMAGRVLYEEDAPALFIVGPEFVRQSMRGRFDHTQVVIGGCDSLSTTPLAEALVERGASAIIGWNGLVDLTHNDRALLYLLRLLTVEGLSPDQAVVRTQQVIGPDPTFNSLPTYFIPDKK